MKSVIPKLSPVARLVGAAAISIAVSACTVVSDFDQSASSASKSFERIDYVALPPAPLPSYEAGDTFVYSDGTGTRLVRRVVGIQGETVNWITEKNFRFASYRNFALPRVEWDGPSSSGHMLNSLRPDQMWPIQPRKSAKITATYEKRIKARNATERYDEFWTCKVNGARPVTVPAGTFDAFKIICRRYDEARDKVTRTHTWFYAPEVGHFVKRIKKYGVRPDQVIELVAYKRGDESG